MDRPVRPLPAGPSRPPIIAGKNGSLVNPGMHLAASVTAALSRPYGTSVGSHYSPHYAQAYQPPAARTIGGYTLSSTYVPGQTYDHVSNVATRGGGPSSSSTGSGTRPPNAKFTSQSNSNSWYIPGSHRCTYKSPDLSKPACLFTGSQKAAEIHMMDRHLIYPPGWEKRKKDKDDWDADPSLKGKPIPILGTTIILDDPEVLDKWIAERKKRWPSSARIEDMQKKISEALKRGQISVDDPGLLGQGFSKRRRLDDAEVGGGHNDSKGRGRGRGGGSRYRNRGGRGETINPPLPQRSTDTGWGARGRGRGGGVSGQPRPQASSALLAIPQNSDASSDSEDDSDAPPEAVSSKIPLTDALPSQDELASPVVELPVASNEVMKLPPTKKKLPLQPKLPPRTPFALNSRPALLRNLLLPEIRMTISNLSQAIRFLVDNDFLEGVELTPGEAEGRLIEVVGEQRMEEEGKD